MKSYPDKGYLTIGTGLLTPLCDSYQILLSSYNGQAFAETEKRWIAEVDRRVMEYIKKNSVEEDQLSSSIIHNDLALEHAQLLKTGEFYLIDFADRCIGPVSWDLAMMAGSFYWSDELSFAKWESLTDLFVEGYSSETCLTSEELAAIKPMMVRQLIGAARYLNLVSNKEQREVDAEGIKRRYKLAHYLTGDI